MMWARWPIAATLLIACVPPRSATPGPAALACGAGLSAASRTTPRGVELWCEDDRGVRVGPYERRLPGGHVTERARYADGVLDGEFTALYASGGLHMTGRYVRGQRDGAWRAWHENGRPWLEVSYAAGQPSGHWLEFDYTGNKMFEGTYRDGRLEGEWRAFRDGGGRAGTSVAGRLEGMVSGRWGEGTVEAHYRNNRLHGTVIQRDKDGKVIYSAEYVDGIQQGSDAR